MKNLILNLFCISISCAFLEGCGSTSDPYQKRAEQARDQQEKTVNKTIDQAPKWMFTLPTSTNAIYESGTAVSSDISMSDLKAKTDAYSKICMMMGGKVSQTTKIYKTDSDATSTDSSQSAIRTSCNETDLSGVEVREIKRVSENGRFRTYVLIALPTDDANLIKRAKLAQVERENAIKNKVDAFKELDAKQ